MLEKRNKILAVSLGGLSLLIFIVLLSGRGDRAFKVEKDLFKGFDLKSADRILLESGSGKTDLRFQGYRWQVNESFDADRSLIEVLFATLKQAEPKRPVAGSLRDSIAKRLKEHGVRISVFTGQEKVKSFFVGGNDQKTQAYFMEELKEDPYVMIIPGYRVYVSGIFELPAQAWRDKMIFSFNWQSFSKLEALYKNTAGNFEVEMRKNQVLIPGIEADTAKLNSYLDQVSLLTVDEYIPPDGITEGLAAQTPVLKLRIHDIANREYVLEVFATESQIFGRINGQFWGILNKNKVLPLLRPKEFFIKG